MVITRTSAMSGITRDMDLNISPEQWQEYLDGEYIQVCMSHLSADAREFIITGTTQEEWDEAFKEIDEPGNNPGKEYGHE